MGAAAESLDANTVDGLAAEPGSHLVNKVTSLEQISESIVIETKDVASNNLNRMTFIQH